MYPQTHLYFAAMVLGKINDAIALGSIFPDMAIGAGVDRDLSHGSGLEIYKYLESHEQLRDFALANITHGVSPNGLDYYGDEKNPPFERGYCFEKGRALVGRTIKACNLPESMGWWKSHNIVEMGIEMRISAGGYYGRLLYQAFRNKGLVEEICDRMGAFFNRGFQPFFQRLSSFPSYIDLSPSTAESLAAKYDYQMNYKHGIRINVEETAELISLASEVVAGDMDEFFQSVARRVKADLFSICNGPVK